MTNPARAPRVCDSVQKSEEVMSDDHTRRRERARRLEHSLVHLLIELMSFFITSGMGAVIR